MRKVLVISLAFAGAFLGGCATGGNPNADLGSGQIAFEPLHLRPVIDPLMCRLDVSRSGVEGKDHVTMTDYSPLAVDFGNGLRLDTNANLYLDPETAFGLGDTYVLTLKSGFATIPYRRNGATYSIGRSTWMLKDDGLLDVGNNQQLVLPVQNGYQALVYNLFGKKALTINMLMKDADTLRYKIDEGIDLQGETILKHDGPAISGRNVDFSDLRISLSADSREIEISFGDLAISLTRSQSTIVERMTRSGQTFYALVAAMAKDRIGVDRVANLVREKPLFDLSFPLFAPSTVHDDLLITRN